MPLHLSGTTAPVWYAIPKNRVYGTGKEPKLILVYSTFDWTLSARLAGESERAVLLAQMGADEPVLRRKSLGEGAGGALWDRAAGRGLRQGLPPAPVGGRQSAEAARRPRGVRRRLQGRLPSPGAGGQVLADRHGPRRGADTQQVATVVVLAVSAFCATPLIVALLIERYVLPRLEETRWWLQAQTTAWAAMAVAMFTFVRMSAADFIYFAF